MPKGRGRYKNRTHTAAVKIIEEEEEKERKENEKITEGKKEQKEEPEKISNRSTHFPLENCPSSM
jgi:hypothetical protein